MGNSGVGLLLLAFGLCLVPLFSDSLDGMQWTLPYLPTVAVGLAFIACFMMAYSKRRSSISSVILAILPLPFVVLLSLGSYYYIENFVVKPETPQQQDDTNVVEPFSNLGEF